MALTFIRSIKEASQHTGIKRGKWLDIWTLCENYLHLFGRDAVINEVYYFSALAMHDKDLDAPGRHQIYIAALRSTGTQPIMGTFKRKRIRCRALCKQDGWGYEEKETDVNIAIKLIELLMTKSCDIPVVISGDTDLAAAIRSAKWLFPGIKVGVGFPYHRNNAELKQLADFSFKIGPQHYQKFVLPDSITLLNGKIISKPFSW